VTYLANIRDQLRNLNLANRGWFNALWFQLTWFACVLGREPWLALTLAMIALHFVLVQSARAELLHIAPLATVGIVTDTLLSVAGVFDFGDRLVPLWLCLLWIAFATTLTRSLAMLGKRAVVAALVGGIGVPFNYAVGERLGAVNFPLDTKITMVILVIVWSALLPTLYRLSKQRGLGV